MSEQYEFWKMILSSPLTLTLSGALVGSFFTLTGVWLKYRYDAKASKKAWERQEIIRKEERLFQNKIESYKKILNWIDENKNCISPLGVYLNSFTYISLFAPDHIREHIRNITLYLFELAQKKSQDYTKEENFKISSMLDTLHTMLMKDLDKHNV